MLQQQMQALSQAQTPTPPEKEQPTQPQPIQQQQPSELQPVPQPTQLLQTSPIIANDISMTKTESNENVQKYDSIRWDTEDNAKESKAKKLATSYSSRSSFFFWIFQLLYLNLSSLRRQKNVHWSFT